MAPAANPDVARAVDRDVVRSQRLLSIDVLRGVTIAFMVFVNSQQGYRVFAPFKHAEWNGFTATDLVFPTFLTVVGVSLVLSMEARLARGVSRGLLALQVVRRSFVLFAFGMLVNTFPFVGIAGVRWYGVLQRTALCYLISGLVLVGSRRCRYRRNALLGVVFCVGIYWLLMRFVPVPGYGVPTHAMPMNDRDGNLAAWVDRAVFSSEHLFERTRDPEGLLSTLPAVGTTLIGLLAGLWLRTRRSVERKAAGLAGAGVALAVAGLAWAPWFPINKKLWTSSYVLFAGGLGLLLLAAAVWLIDAKRLGRSGGEERPAVWMPWLVFGTNAITAYLFSELIFCAAVLLPIPRSGGPLRALWAWLQVVLPGYGWASFWFSVAVTVMTWAAVYPLYRKRIFLRV